VDELHWTPCFMTRTTRTNTIQAVSFPAADAGIAIEPERRGDEQRLADTLQSSWRKILASGSSTTPP